jgi:hypothetical protein
MSAVQKRHDGDDRYSNGVDNLADGLSGLTLKSPSLTVSVLPPQPPSQFFGSPGGSPTSRKRAKRSEHVGMGLAGVKSFAEEALDSELHAAMLGDGVLEMMTEIMRNTMLNIMQEATYGEFSLLAEPVKFVMKD